MRVSYIQLRFLLMLFSELLYHSIQPDGLHFQITSSPTRRQPQALAGLVFLTRGTLSLRDVVSVTPQLKASSRSQHQRGMRCGELPRHDSIDDVAGDLPPVDPCGLDRSQTRSFPKRALVGSWTTANSCSTSSELRHDGIRGASSTVQPPTVCGFRRH